ncbi:MAG: DUF1848 domain-containing protein [Clostridia bacterium]|nr:DUF1848 domain-containing protein [Clostridia bacterium]
MILSVSRRTDIPAFFSPWFFRRLNEGFVLVRNPMNPHRISRVPLTPDVLDGIVFWTKNPVPMLPYLEKLTSVPFYIQCTLTSCGQDLEPGVPSKSDVLIPALCEIASVYGKERTVWRYDPILLSPKYTVDYHIRYFAKMAQRLAGTTTLCILSFLDLYRHSDKRFSPHGIRPPDQKEIGILLTEFMRISRETGIALRTCAEEGDYSAYGILPASCIDKERLERIGGHSLSVPKDKNQRPACACDESIDIGAYNTCPHGCVYCYANYIPSAVSKNRALHDPSSPLLFGAVGEDDIITDRKCRSLRIPD